MRVCPKSRTGDEKTVREDEEKMNRGEVEAVNEEEEEADCVYVWL